MKTKPGLVLDARKAYDSGIGTYIRNLIPFLDQEFDLTLIGNEKELSLFGTRVLHTESKAYSLSDFYLPATLAPSTDIFWTPHFNYPLLPPKAKLKVSTIYDLYHKANWDILSFKQKLIYTIFLENVSRRSDLVFTISDFTKQEINRFYPVMIPKTHVIHLGVDFDLFKIDPEKSVGSIKEKYKLPDKYILFVGNLKPNKNIINLLKGFKKVLEREPLTDIRIVITGKKGGFRIGDNEAVDYILNNNLEQHVHFTGFVDERDLPLLYQYAWLFVFPSLYEGFGLPPLEAMACGCPVACSTSASIPEVCQDYAFYFDGQKPEELSALLLQFMKDEKLLLSKSVASEWVKRYDWSVTAENHIRILKDGLRKRD